MDQFEDTLPLLDAEALRKITGNPDLTIAGSVSGRDGFFAVGSPKDQAGRSYRTPPANWSDKDVDWTLNNVLDWRREHCAAYRFKKADKIHDLLFLRPEAIECYLSILREPPSAAELFNKLLPAQRVLGYVLVPAGQTQRYLIVADTLLGDATGWPPDEEDLLDPVSDEAAKAVGR